MLRDLNIKTHYRTYLDDPIKDFFMPSFANSKIFDRGVGFFTLSSLVDMLYIDSGLIEFLKNDGNIRVITSPFFNDSDTSLIQHGIKKAENVANELIEKEINKSLDLQSEKPMDLLCNLIASNRLIIKIAVPKAGGLYHEKIGFFFDNNNDAIYFSGSNNQTSKANTLNLESLLVVKSWEDSTTIQEEYEFFNKMWNNEFTELEVYTFPQALKEKLINKYQRTISIDDAIDEYKRTSIKEKNNSKIKLRNYQIQAIEEFTKYKHHLFKMATGTGKTFTAVMAIKKIITNHKYLIVVIVPYTALLEQWSKEFTKQGLDSTTFCGTTNNNYLELTIDYQMNSNSTIIISTYDTYFSKMANSFINQRDLIFIADEAHNITPNYFLKLPQKAEYKLGLSATPERYDKKETIKLFNYFLYPGQSPFTYNIEEAIEAGFLSHYNYHIFKTFLNDIETNNYKKLTKRICVLLNEKHRDYDQIRTLVTTRSLILKKATNKIQKLQEIIDNQNVSFSNSVVYCGQGITDNEPIIDAITKIIGQKYKVQQYTSKKTNGNRKEILDNFYSNKLDALIAIRCLDEGVDIPKLSKIFIISSDGAIRQTVQRRGRVLRVCKETDKSKADIYDFLILPNPSTAKTEGKAIVISELRRIREYNSLADNKDENSNYINSLETEYSITESDYLQEKNIMEEN